MYACFSLVYNEISSNISDIPELTIRSIIHTKDVLKPHLYTLHSTVILVGVRIVACYVYKVELCRITLQLFLLIFPSSWTSCWTCIRFILYSHFIAQIDRIKLKFMSLFYLKECEFVFNWDCFNFNNSIVCIGTVLGIIFRRTQDICMKRVKYNVLIIRFSYKLSRIWIQMVTAK